MTSCLLTRRFSVEFTRHCSSAAAGARYARRSCQTWPAKAKGPTVEKRTCSDPKCDRGAVSRGMCGKHYARWRRILAFNPDRESAAHLRNYFINRTGQRYGRLTVIGRAPSRPGIRSVLWLCRCDCGNETTVRSGDLTKKKNPTISCGCARGSGHRLPAGTAARNIVRKGYEKNARLRGLAWELAEGDFDDLASQPCHYCGEPPCTTRVVASGDAFVYNGIDRVDNSLGYVGGNVVPCCKTCNYAKRDMPYSEFIAWIARLTEYQFFRPDMLPSRLLKDSGAGR